MTLAISSVLSPEIFVQDIGTELRVQVVDQSDTPVPLNAAVELKIYAEKPDGTVVSWTATPGSAIDVDLTADNGWMHYVTIAGDIDQTGHWKLQGSVQLTTGRWRTDVHDILVHAILA